MIRFILVRHGESLWNREHRYQGQQDSGLTALGRQQSARVAELLAAAVPQPAAVWSSDLPRAHDTAAAYVGLVDAPIRVDQRLREVDIGDWSGRLLTDVAREHHAEVTAAAAGEDVRRGGGETFGELRHRVVAWLDDAVAAQANEDAGVAGATPTILAFSHGGAIRVAAAHAAGVAAPGHVGMGAPTNCSRTELRSDGTQLTLATYNLPLP